MILSPKQSAQFIINNADHIILKEDGINQVEQKIMEGILKNELNTKNFSQCEFHPNQKDTTAANWIFLIDSLNFCFWTSGDTEKWKIKNYTGYFALCAGIKRAIEEGINITDPKYYKGITKDEFLYIFRSDDGNKTIIPLADERVNCLHEIGEKLVDKFAANFKNCILLANNSAQELLKIIVEEFPCYRDEAIYKNMKVSFYKRAQILIGDIWSCYQGKGCGYFNDIYDTITMFPDYRVPQVLLYFKAFEYSEELLQLLRKNIILENGDSKEIEIRGASIYAVELLKEKVLKKLEEQHPEIDRTGINSILIDHFLWDYRRKHIKELESIPFHKVLCIYY